MAETVADQVVERIEIDVGPELAGQVPDRDTATLGRGHTGNARMGEDRLGQPEDSRIVDAAGQKALENAVIDVVEVLAEIEFIVPPVLRPRPRELAETSLLCFSGRSSDRLRSNWALMSPFTPESRRRQRNRVALGDERDEFETAILASRAGMSVEGAFGLFQQTAPPVELDSSSPRELAQQVLALVVQVWARTLNHRPRPDRGDRSRVEQYHGDVPTPQEVKDARSSLAERLRKQEAARETRRARLDPQVSALLDEAFERLDLVDPERRIRDGIAIHPLDAILPGIAIYETRARRGTLPEGVDARYLQGIVRNIAQEDEGVAISDALLRLRLKVRDAAVHDLQATHARVLRENRQTVDCIPRFLDAALETDRLLDRHFWLSAAADLIPAHAEARCARDG